MGGWRLGGILGCVLGAYLGSLIATAENERHKGELFGWFFAPMDDWIYMSVGAVIGGVVGALLGDAVAWGLSARAGTGSSTEPSPAERMAAEVNIDGYRIEVQGASARTEFREGGIEVVVGGHVLVLEPASGELAMNGVGLGVVHRGDHILVIDRGVVSVNGIERRGEGGA